jgi:hypothetical protein
LPRAIRPRAARIWLRSLVSQIRKVERRSRAARSRVHSALGRFAVPKAYRSSGNASSSIGAGPCDSHGCRAAGKITQHTHASAACNTLRVPSTCRDNVVRSVAPVVATRCGQPIRPPSPRKDPIHIANGVPRLQVANA